MTDDGSGKSECGSRKKKKGCGRWIFSISNIKIGNVKYFLNTVNYDEWLIWLKEFDRFMPLNKET